MALSILLSVAVNCWFFLAFTSAGYVCIRRLRIPFDHRILRVICGYGLGFGVAGNCIMAACFLRCATPAVIGGLVVACTVAGMTQVRSVLDDCTGLMRDAAGLLRSSQPFAGGLLCALVCGYCARGLLPPTDFDGLMYHLSTAKLYLQHGGFWNIYFNAQSDYPMLTEMHFMIGLALKNDSICKTQSFVLGACTLALIAHLCIERFNEKKIVVPALLVFCTFTAVIANMSNCDVDIPQALWTMLAVCMAEEYFKIRKFRILFLSAIFAGMAVETKVFGIFAVPLLLARIGLQWNDERMSGRTFREACMTLFIPVAMGVPWYLKSYLYTGTILSIRHSSIAGQGLAAPMGVTAAGLWYWILNIPVRILAAPWTFSIFPGQHQSDTVGPLFLAIVPFLFFIKIPRKIKHLALLMLTYWIVVIGMEIGFIQGGASIRYAMTILVGGAPLIAWILHETGGMPKVNTLLKVPVFCMVVLGSLIFFKRYHKDWLALVTCMTKDRYLTAVLPEYPVIQTINRLQGEKVIMPVYNYSDYLIDRPYITAYRRYASVEDMTADFREKNIGYIFANDKLDLSANRDAFPEYPGKEAIDSTNGFYLFKLSEVR
jgi:hypothetical protein